MEQKYDEWLAHQHCQQSAGCLGVLIVIGLLIWGMCAIDNSAAKKRHQLLEQQASQFGPCKVIEVYRIREGTKPANYSYRSMAVVENSRGERLEVVIDQPVIIGDNCVLRPYDGRCFMCLVAVRK